MVPQTWTIVITSVDADYDLTGSVTGPDGKGNARQPFKSASGQIIIEPELWRRSERNRTGDRFTFEVKRAVVNRVSFDGAAGKRFTIRLAQMLPNRKHTVELRPAKEGTADIESAQA